MRILGLMFVLSMATASMASAVEGETFMPTDTGFVRVPADSAKVLEAHQKWLAERLSEAQSITPGTTYGELTRYFRQDGGLSTVQTHRFVMILCPLIKVDVEFNQDEKHAPFRPSVESGEIKIKSISKPYLEQPYSD